MYKLQTLLILCLLSSQVTNNYVSFASFSGSYPAGMVDVGSLSGITSLTMTVTCTQPKGSLVFYLCRGSDLNHLVCLTPGVSIDDYTTSLVLPTVSATYRGWMSIAGGTQYQQCTVTVIANGNTIVNTPMIFNYGNYSPVHKITVNGACTIRISYTGQAVDTISVYTIAGLRGDQDAIQVLNANQGDVTLPAAGDFYISLVQVVDPPNQLSPYTITVTTSCDDLCVDPNSSGPAPVCDVAVCGNGILERGEQCDNGNKTGCENCRTASGYACYGQIGSGSVCTKQKVAVCGDGILDYGEQCDNGNKPGCIGCKVAAGYECKGNIGGTSICSKSSACGDGVLDQGEQCDNGNKLGCSFNCQVDAGFNCVSSIGFPSVCGFCGNGIVETGEECDNKNSLGCSVNCKVDAGFSCRGVTPSICFRNNPVCGNGLSEVGEACDDGNKLTGDGCGSTCLVEQGYTCTGEPSKCSKKPADSPVCGNGKFQPNNEQCDNGNKDGCLKCVVQSGWSCASRVGLPSVCLPKVVAPHCGNGVHEPQQNEVCDDGNINNGDGCNNLCQVEFGWVCIDGKKCINTEDPTQVKILCGNGKVQRLYGETCDDGNTANGDGCSGGCKVEGGWSCRVFSPEENRSYCRRDSNGSGFCGNGVLDGNEECDDGFPLRNGDGCSIGCRIESGWSCGSISFSQVSKCWKL